LLCFALFCFHVSSMVDCCCSVCVFLMEIDCFPDRHAIMSVLQVFGTPGVGMA